MVDENVDNNEVVEDNTESVEDSRPDDVKLREQSISRIDEIMHPKEDSEESNDKDDNDDEQLDTEGDEDGSSESSESEDKTELNKDSKENEYEQINPTVAMPFVQAAIQKGWSRERIRDYAAKHDDADLLIMTGLLGGENVAAEETDKDDKQTFKLDEALFDKLSLEDEDKGVLKELLSPLVSQLSDKEKMIKDLESRLDLRETTEKQSDGVKRFNLANEMFDAVSEDLPSFGKTDGIPTYPDGTPIESSPEVKLRSKLFKTASVLYNSGEYGFKQAMDIAIDAYKGSAGKKEFSNSMIKKLKKGEQKLSAKGKQKQTTTKYTNERERKAAVINDSLKKHNLQIPQ